MSFFLGIDGGGTKTSCVVGDETSVLGAGTASGSNVVRVGEQHARGAFRDAITQACATAKISPSQIERTCAGLAGGARPEIAARVRAVLAELVAGEIVIVGDMVIAHEAAFHGGAGVVVSAGPGSNAYGSNEVGAMARAGGWGFAVSDEGSGHWIGRSAISAALRAYDETASGGVLLERIMESWHLATRDQLVIAANASPAPYVAGILPAVLAAAEAGDATARDVLGQAGGELAKLAAIVVGRLFADAPAGVATAGGIFSNSALVREVFFESVRNKYPKVLEHPASESPVNGALALARKGSRKL
jgi:N-acetylglucosamine kinase-like BadF-type ATPase